MDTLPFLIAHGAWVGYGLLAVWAAAGGAAYVYSRRRREAQLIRELLALRREVLTPARPGIVTISGKLVGDVQTLATDGDIPRSRRSDEVALETDGQRIVLEGPIDAAFGTTATAARSGAPAGTPPELATNLSHGAHRLYAVKSGDEVIVQGTLVTAGDAWKITPTAPNITLEVLPVAPAIRPPPIAVMALALAALAGGLVGYIAMRVIGKQLVSRLADRDTRGRTRTSIPTSIAIAAALPGARASALREVHSIARYELARTEALRPVADAAIGLVDGCADELDQQLDDARYDAALVTARGCGDAHGEMLALAGLGKYDEAGAVAAAHPAPDDEAWNTVSAVSAIVAGRWPDAAKALDGLSVYWAHPRPHDYHSEDDRQVLSSRAACLAAYLRVKLGAADAQKQLQALAESTHSIACATELALVAPAEQRAALLTAAHDAYERKQGDIAEVGDALLADSLRWLDGSNDMVPSSAWQTLIEAKGDRGQPWGAPWALAASTEPYARSTALVELAIEDTLLGDAKAATDHLNQARDAVGTDHSYALTDALLTIGLRGPTTDLAIPDSPIVDDLARIRVGQSPRELHEIDLECSYGLQVAINTAINGNGANLVHMMQECNVVSLAGELLAVLPRVKTQRAEIASQLRINGAALDNYPESPLRQLAVDSLRRDLARLAGDEPSATAWQAAIDRVKPVLTDRDRLIALTLLDEMK